jgi:hypothetical protein
MKVTGSAEIRSALANIVKHTPEQVGDALTAEMEIEKTESMRRTPVDTGLLRASHYVAEPEHSLTGVSVQIGVGGGAVDYAVPVHEDLEAFHPVGQAKFLESTLLESAPHMAERVGRRLDLDELVR